MSAAQDYTIALQANEARRIQHLGRYWRVKSTSVAGLKVQLQFDQTTTFEAEAGDRGEMPESYTEVQVTSPVAATVVLQLGQYPIASDSAVVNVANVTATFEENNSGASIADQVLATATGAIISPARASKREIAIKMPVTNTGPVRVGPSAGPGVGLPLEPGGSAVLSGSLAISAYNENTDSQTVCVVELDRIP